MVITYHLRRFPVSQILLRRLFLILTCGYFLYCGANRLRKRQKLLWRSIGTGSLQMKHNLFGWEFWLFSPLLVLLTDNNCVYALPFFFSERAWNYSCYCFVLSFGILERYLLRSTMNFTRRPSMSTWIPWPPHTSLQRCVSLHLIGSLYVVFGDSIVITIIRSWLLYHIICAIAFTQIICAFRSLHTAQFINKC